MTPRSIYRPPWRIDLTKRTGVPDVLPAAEIARVAGRALDVAAPPRPASLGVILSDDAELASLNAEHMGSAGPTDVLAFPLLPPEVFRGGRALAFPLPPGRRVHLGDVIVSVERAIDQASVGRGGQAGDVQWSSADELRLLVTHGVLHVCGWDHAEPAEEAAMRALERRLIERERGARRRS